VLVVLERVCPAVVSAAAVVKGDLCGVAVLVGGGDRCGGILLHWLLMRLEGAQRAGGFWQKL